MNRARPSRTTRPTRTYDRSESSATGRAGTRHRNRPRGHGGRPAAPSADFTPPKTIEPALPAVESFAELARTTLRAPTSGRRSGAGSADEHASLRPRPLPPRRARYLGRRPASARCPGAGGRRTVRHVLGHEANPAQARTGSGPASSLAENDTRHMRRHARSPRRLRGYARLGGGRGHAPMRSGNRRVRASSAEQYRAADAGGAGMGHVDTVDPRSEPHASWPVNCARMSRKYTGSLTVAALGALGRPLMAVRLVEPRSIAPHAPVEASTLE